MTERAPRRPLPLLAGLLGFAGYAQTVNGVAAPFLAEELGLDDAALARAFAWIACNALLVIVLARETDRFGRRRLLLACAAGLPVAAVATMLAPGLASWIAAQIVLQGLASVLVMLATVVITEELPLADRARGQATGGIAATIGAGLALGVTSLAANSALGWRATWVVCVLAALLWPRLRRAFPETVRWRNAADRGDVERARMREALSPPYRGRVIGLVSFVGIGGIAGTATGTWPYYHAVHDLGLDPGSATLIMFAAGLIGIFGFRLGGVLSDRIGRRATLALGSLASTALGVCFYRLPPPLASAWLLALVFGLAMGMGNASIVALRSSATELFPTRLRSTVNGWAAAIGSLAGVGANFATASLAEQLGGMVPAIGWLALAIVPACLAFLLFVPETAGMELESAALELVEVEACIALGSNLGDRAAHLAQALRELAASPGVDVEAVSRWYQTDPVGPPPQGPYLNAAVRVRTTLAPHELLARLLEIEAAAGRERGPERDLPRTLDLDLLLYGDLVLEAEDLVVPHPRMHERAFVLVPLAEVAGDRAHPVLAVTIDALASAAGGSGSVRAWEPPPER